MQIRYRITLMYTMIVTIIVLLLCFSIYFFSYENRNSQFNNRLAQKAIGVSELLWTYNVAPELIKDINHTSPSALAHKCIIVYDDHFQSIFNYYDQKSDSVSIPVSILKRSINRKPHFFKINHKDAVSIWLNRHGKDYIFVVAAYDEDRADWLPKLRLILFSSFIISISIVIISGYFFSVNLVRAISILKEKIDHISSKEFSPRLTTGSGKDELQRLAITINNLLDRLQSSFDTQRGFIDNASHELSTPLASIGSQLDVVLQKERTNEEYRAVLKSVKDDVRRLGFLVRSLLEIAKISGSAKGIELAVVRIDELLMRMPGELKKIKPSYDVKLLFDELPDDEEDLIIYGNEELLFTALKNIAHNACKFSQDQTAIITLHAKDGNILVKIKDNGPGIKNEDFVKIFQPFYRSPDVTNLVSGTGLGLPLANQIIKLYGGTIRIESAIGKGTTFTVTLKTKNP